MRIFFTNPPLKELHFSRSQRSPGVIKSGTMYYPYWLAHCAALAQERGHEIFLLDCPADRIYEKDLLDSIDAFNPDLIIMDTSTPSIEYDLKLASTLKKASLAKLVLVGTHVTSEWRSCLEQNSDIDFVAIGEYDFTIIDLATALTENTPISEVAGIAYHLPGEEIVKTDIRVPLEDLDELPWIAPIYKRFLTPENYLFTIARQPMVMLIGGRGCKAKCFYCVYPQVMHGHSYRTRSLKHLVGEMKWIEENMPEIQEIVFEDDTFTSDSKRAREFASMIQSEGIRLPWFANIRTNIDTETLSALKDAGLRECAVGFESGDDLILGNMRKGQTVKRQRQFMTDCKELGILVHGCFMVGFPGETSKTMQATLDLAIDLSPDSAQFYPVMPYPGTGAYQWAKDNDYLTTEKFDEWLDENGSHKCVLNLPGLGTEQMEEFCEYAFKKFHFRSDYIIKKLLQAFTNPREGIRSVNAGFNFILSLLTKRKHGHSSTRLIQADERWRAKIKTPHGRMEELEQVIKINKKKGIPVQQFQEALRDSESKTER